MHASRRSLIVGMTAISACLIMTGLAGPAQAASKSSRRFWSFAPELFAELAAWFIKEALPSRLTELPPEDLKRSEEATPGGTPFHNDFACAYQIPLSFGPLKTRYSFCLAVKKDGFLRAHDDENIPDIKDMNGPELRRIQYIHKKNDKTLLFPCSPREAPNQKEKVNFSTHCKKNNLKREDWDLMYCRAFNDGKNMYRGYAIKKKGLESQLDGATDLLIADD